MKECNEWLVSLAGCGIRWEDDMEVIVKANSRAMQSNKAPQSTDV